jgi:hypothetical protein
VTQTTSIYSDRYQSTELDVFNLHEKKAWTKPEIREINFKETAQGGADTTDSLNPS